MQPRTFRGRTMREALNAVKAALGAEAIILSAREMAAGMGVEVTAAGTEDTGDRQGPVYAPPTVAEEQKSGQIDDPVTAFRQEMAALKAEMLEILQQVRREGDPHRPSREIRELRHLLQPLLEGGRASVEHRLPLDQAQAMARLTGVGVSAEIAQQLIRHLPAVERLEDTELLDQYLAEALAAEIMCTGPGIAADKPFRVALVGATGEGKTTLIAKLAARASLAENRRVAMITIDTYRMAAIEQARKYAEILDIPFEVAASPRAFEEAMERYHNYDAVFVDTAGRSPLDERRMEELAAYVAGRPDLEVHLVLSAATSAHEMENRARAFQTTGYSAIALTKLDEATRFGDIYNIHVRAGRPLSYLSIGQRVPEDVELATADRLAQLILHGGPVVGEKV